MQPRKAAHAGAKPDALNMREASNPRRTGGLKNQQTTIGSVIAAEQGPLVGVEATSMLHVDSEPDLCVTPRAQRLCHGFAPCAGRISRMSNWTEELRAYLSWRSWQLDYAAAERLHHHLYARCYVRAACYCVVLAALRCFASRWPA